MNARAEAASSVAISVMSAPPMKARVPAPRKITTRSVGSAASASTASISAVITARFSVFSFAALAMVTQATPRASRLISIQSGVASASPARSRRSMDVAGTGG